jgi:hypothetical protein
LPFDHGGSGHNHDQLGDTHRRLRSRIRALRRGRIFDRRRLVSQREDQRVKLSLELPFRKLRQLVSDQEIDPTRDLRVGDIVSLR